MDGLIDLEPAKRLRFAWYFGSDTLYKFRSFSGRSRRRVLDTIENSRIYLPHPSAFNDPFDVSPVVVHGGDLNDPEYVRSLEAKQRRMEKAQGVTGARLDRLRKRTGVTIHDLPRAAEAHLRTALRDDVRVLCLSANQLHPLQWSHYADSHRGVCLHFRCRPGTPFGLARQVRYRKNRAALSTLLEHSSDVVMDRLVFNKAKFWSCESEYRIIATESVRAEPALKNGYMGFDPSLLVGITFGLNMPEKQRCVLMAHARRHNSNIAFWEVIEDRCDFGLTLKRFQGPAASPSLSLSRAIAATAASRIGRR
jgi:Protein of unknown function (DUF2971)